ncbi:tetratricopeptide repeat protein [Kitasatospora sp. NPDC058478]|uniref:tetratricopeptide repeat protein n=1 Tax=unclassified Kitasatospora TaxID=2633591 RepID=UPI00365C5FFA
MIANHALDQAYQRIGTTKATRLYRVLGLLPSTDTTIDTAMAGAAARLDPATTLDLLARLTDRQLLTAPDGPDGPYRFATTTVRRHASHVATSIDNQDTRGRLIKRALDWLLAEAVSACRLTDPHRRPIEPPITCPPPHRLGLTSADQALTFLTNRGRHLTAALPLATVHHRAAVPHLVHAFWPHYLRERNYTTWVHDHTLALTILDQPTTAAQRLLRRELLSARATALRGLRRFTVALENGHEALALARADDDQPGIAQHQHDLGVTLHPAGAPDLARTYLLEALRGRTALGRRRDAALTLLTLAVTDLDREAPPADVVEKLRAAERDLTAEGDLYNATRARAWRGRVLVQAGRYDEATPLFTSALTDFAAQGALWQARILTWSAEAFEERGQAGRAAVLYRQALDLYRDRSPHDHLRVSAALARLSGVHT